MNKYAFLTMALIAFFNVNAQALLLFQKDDLSSGTTDGWQVGINDPTGPININTGGPAGLGDAYLNYTSDGAGAGGRMVVFNTAQWAGDYLTSGITSISMDLNNLGATALEMRLRLEGAGGNFVTISSFALSPGSGWQTATFDILPSNLTGGANVNSTLGGVTRLRIFHGTSASFPGAPIVADLGVDNITSVPEPSSLMFSLISVSLLFIRRRKNCV